MAANDESSIRMRAAGKSRTDAQAKEPDAYRRGRDDLWNCAANSTRRTTSNAIAECSSKLQK